MAETLMLSRPLRVGGEDVMSLTLREPTLGMLDGVALRITAEGELNIDLGAIRLLLGRMADIPPTVASELTIRDAIAAKDVIADFFGDFLPTGEASLPN